MSNIEVQNILLEFGNRLLDVANNKENPTLGELIDTPAQAIHTYYTNLFLEMLNIGSKFREPEDELDRGVQIGYDTAKEELTTKIRGMK